MAVEANAEQVMPLPLGCALASSPPTVGDLLTRRASAAVTNRECSSPRSLLSRILHRRRNSGFGCRLRLLPRYCSSGAAKDDAIAITVKEELAAPKVVGSRAEPARESPRSSLAEKKAPSMADDALPASLGLGASLVLLLSKSAAELSRMAELRAQMERMMMDVRADVGSCNGRPSASDGHTHTDSTSVVKEPIAQSLGGSENAERGETIDQMEAEVEAELSRLQLASNNDEATMTPQQDTMTPQQDQVEAEAKSAGATSGDHSVICTDSDIDNGATEQDGDEGQDDDDEDDEEEDGDEESPGHGGVSARELERRLHELLQSRHEERIAELESALERARRKLKEKEREASRWRDTAKLAARFTDDSRLR